MIILSNKELNSFWRRVKKSDRDSCWPWAGATAGGQRIGGYGVFSISRNHGLKNRSFYTHRVSYCLSKNISIDSLNSKIEIRHKCHNPLCCNPNHLCSGTHRQNVHDSLLSGRIARGEDVAGSKLTKQNIIEIKKELRRGDKTHKEIAEKYNVCRTTISLISSGKNWSWVK